MSLRAPGTSTIIATLMLCVLLVGALSCGKREWPSPVQSEDRFRLRTVTAQRAQDCIVVDCELAGAWQNLHEVRLLIEVIGTEPGDGCATCPFVPRIVRQFGPGSPAMRQDMNRVVITACGLDPKKTYRLQVVASNVFPALSLVMSNILTTSPQ